MLLFRQGIGGYRFSNSDLGFANFSKAKITGCNFEDCMLPNASFANGDLRNGNKFNNLDIHTTNLKGAKIYISVGATIAGVLWGKIFLLNKQQYKERI